MNTLLRLLLLLFVCLSGNVSGADQNPGRVFDLYGGLVGKAVLRPGHLPRVQLPDLPASGELDSRSNLISKIETGMSEAGLEIIPDGEKFVWVVPAGISNSPVLRDLARIRRPKPGRESESESGEESPLGIIDFRDLPLDPALRALSELSGRTLLRPGFLPYAQVSLVSPVSLTKEELVYALSVALVFNGVAVIEDGPKFFQLVPVRQSAGIRAAAPKPEEGEAMVDPASLPWLAPREGNSSRVMPKPAQAADLLEHYARLTGRRVADPLQFGDRPVWFEPKTPLTRGELLYGIETALALNGLSIAVDENGAVSLTVAGEKRPAPIAAERPSQDRPGRP